MLARTPHSVLYGLLFLLILILSISHLTFDPNTTTAKVLGVLAVNRGKFSTFIPNKRPKTIYDSLRKHAINNTVIIVPINNGMMHFGQNLVCSLRKNTDFDPKKLVFWTLGEEVGSELRKQGLTTFHDPALWGTSDNVGKDYSTEGFDVLMKERPKFWADVLATGLDMLFLDADLIFYASPLNMITPHVDLAIASDGREYFGDLDSYQNAFKDGGSKGPYMPPVCAGTFWAKSNPETINFFRLMQNVFDKDPITKQLGDLYDFNDDQRAFDSLLNDGRAVLSEPLPQGITPDMIEDGHKPDEQDQRMKVVMWDQAKVVSGHLYKEKNDEYKEHLERLEEEGQKNWVIHLNWFKVGHPRMKGAKEMGIWHLTDDGQCKS